MYNENEDFIEVEDEVYYGTFQQIVEYCLLPTITQTFKFVAELIAFNVVFLCLNRWFVKTKEHQFHVISAVTGLTYIYLSAFLYNTEALYIIPLVYISYGVLLYTAKIKERHINIGFCIGAAFISILVSCEFFYTDHEAWLKIRGIVMIAMMKIMSIAFDAEKGTKVPSLWSYSGYIWCPANSVLGPWITYKDYIGAFRERHKLNKNWVFAIIYYLLLAFMFVCFSNCIYSYFITDVHNEFIISYRDAASFRMSHYFVSFIASAAMITAGFNNASEKSGKWLVTVTKPLEVEMPRSLVHVVINWNVPTHTFLKKYIFPEFLPHGQFIAVLMTYLISSMLHGLSIEVSVVLLSLGIFSYVQTTFQDCISTLFDACVKVRPCRHCVHRHKSKSVITIMLNLLFAFTSVVYLAYVGCLMENIGTLNGSFNVVSMIFYKWGKLSFIGHTMAGASIVSAWYVRKFL